MREIAKDKERERKIERERERGGGDHWTKDTGQ